MNTTNTMDDFKTSANGIGDQAKNTGSRIADEAKYGAQKMMGDAKASGSVIGNEVKNFITDLEEMVSSKAHGALDVGKIKSDLSARIASYKSSIESAGQHAMSDAKHRVEGVNTYVHDEPWKAIGVSFAVGLLLGVVVARR